MVQSRFTPPFSETQEKVLAIIPKLTAVPSLLGAALIIQDVLRKKTWRTYHRIMLVMSTMDFIYALKCFMSTWIIPEDTGFWGARGNVHSCDVWAFLGHGSSLTSVIYNGSLALYFVLTISYNWRETALRKTGIEFMFHVVPLTVGWSTAVASLLLELNNPIGWTCWIGTYPPGCGLPAPWSPPCERGSVKAVDVHRWTLFHAELWLVFCLCTIAMIILVVRVRRQEISMERYHFPTQSDSNSTSAAYRRRLILSRKVTIQASLYIVFFFITWVFPMVQFVVANQTGYLLYPLLILTVIFNPLQGAYDALIYFRPRYLHQRARREEARRTVAQIETSGGGSGQNIIMEDGVRRFDSFARTFLSNAPQSEIEGEIMPEAPIADNTTVVSEPTSPNQLTVVSESSPVPKR